MGCLGRVPRAPRGAAAESSGEAGGGAASGKSASRGVPSPALAERRGRPPPHRRSLALLRHPSPARRARLLSECCGSCRPAVPGPDKGDPRGCRPRVRQAGGGPRVRRGGGEAADGWGAGERGEPKRAGGERVARPPASLLRLAPPAHAAVCFVDGAFPDSPGEPSSAPGGLRRDVPPELESFCKYTRCGSARAGLFARQPLRRVPHNNFLRGQLHLWETPPPLFFLFTETRCPGGRGGEAGRALGVSHPRPQDNSTRASRSCYKLCLKLGAALGLGGGGLVGRPTWGPLSLPISRRWRFILREVAFFCFLCHEHMEVNLDLSPWPKIRAGG